MYSVEDQKLTKSVPWEWDYDNPGQITNRVKVILENADPQELTDEEQYWRQEILWFWYHHAISTAVMKKDKEKAQEYALKALEHQSHPHPNKITRLLYLLVNDKLEEAQEWAKTIDEDPEKDTATYLLNEYKEDRFF